jgi:phosphate-selective porin OprO/OprP
LPDLLSRAWYLAGTWVLTGQTHLDREEPPAHLMNGRGIGALEVAARYEQMRFSSAGSAGALPSRSTRAANVFAQSDRVWTFGVNWYVNRWIKTQVNGIREQIEDTQRSPVPGKPRLWTWVLRIQYIL